MWRRKTFSVLIAKFVVVDCSGLHLNRAENFTYESQNLILVEDIHKAEVYEGICAKLAGQWGAQVRTLRQE